LRGKKERGFGLANEKKNVPSPEKNLNHENHF